jgi:hypothetical protein
VVINALTHQGQIEGGMMQGLDMALCEEMLIEDGHVTTLSLGDYKIPTARDLPRCVKRLWLAARYSWAGPLQRQTGCGACHHADTTGHRQRDLQCHRRAPDDSSPLGGKSLWRIMSETIKILALQLQKNLLVIAAASVSLRSSTIVPSLS